MWQHSRNLQLSVVWLLLSLLSIATTQVIYVNRSSPNAVNTSECWKGGYPCSTFDLGIAGLHNFSKAMELIIAEGDYNFINNETGHFNYTNGISIIGKADNMNGNTKPVTIKCSEGVGFSFINCSNITINGIIFNGCSQLQNSTSYNKTNGIFSLFNVCLYFLYCSDVSLTYVIVENTKGVGVVLYNTGGSSIIDYCEFLRNQFQDNTNMSGGGGVYIEYSYCVPTASGTNCLDGTSDTNVNNSYVSDANFVIRNSSFIYNRANISNFANETFILPHKQYHAAFGRGGGFSAFFKGDSHNITITIEHCFFLNNSALWGGGIFIEFQDTSHNNTVSIISSFVFDNSLYYNDTRNEGTGGGGSRVGFIFYDHFVSYNNLILFDNCQFLHNDAYYGGGVSFYTAKPPIDTQQNQLVLKNCNFKNNSAKLGAAIDLSVWHPSVFGIVPQTVIENCNFIHNNPEFKSHQGGLIGAGAVYVDGIQVKFCGVVQFLYNQGSALAITGSFVEMLNNSDVTFQNNTGRNGGAIALLGNAFILTHYNASLSFINNSAYYHGGAIYSFSSGERNLISSRNCMIRFINIDYQPKKWTSSFLFTDNTANHTPNAIYASTILPCVWGGAEGSTVNDDKLDKNVFCWNDNWVYYDSNAKLNCSIASQNLISTAPSKFSPDSNTSYSVVPGEVISLELPVFDDMNNNVTDSVTFIARILDPNNGASFPGGYDYTHVSHEDLRLHGKPNTTIQVKIETMDPIVIQNNINISFLKCPPGFQDPSSEANYCHCNKTRIYNNYVHCYQSTFSITIVRTIWIGEVNISGNSTEVAGGSPYISSVGNGQFVTLDKSHNNSDEVFCNKLNRTGPLCGKCIKNYGVAVNSEDYHCVYCDDEKARYSWFFYLLSEYLPVTILFAIIFMFSITLTFGPLNSFIFFAQVITTVVKVNADGMIYLNTKAVSYETLKSLYMVPYDIWNMNFFRYWIPGFCLNKNMNTLNIMSLELIQAIYPLLLLLLFVSIVHLYSRGKPCIVCLFRPFHRCIARFRQWTNLRQSITGGMAVFIIISYTKFTLISILLLTPASLYYFDNSVAEQVYYYAGNVNYQKNKAYSISAGIALLIFGIIPPILLFYPTLLKLINRLSCNQFNVGKLSPPLKLQAFLDEFHGCYKDGMDGGLDCRWFASFYFCLRIILFAIYASTEHWYTQYTVQILLFLFATILIALLQPYREAWINAVDMSMFILLTAISSLSMLNLFRTWIGEEPQIWAFIVQYILIFIPLMYCIAYYSIMLYTRIKSNWVKKRSVDETLLEQTEDESDSSLVDSTHVPNFLDYMENTGRMKGRTRVSNSQQRSNCMRNDPGSINRLGMINSNQTSSENTPLLTHGSSNTSTSSSQASNQGKRGGRTGSEERKRETQEGIVKRKDEDADNDENSTMELTDKHIQVNSEAHHTIPTGEYRAMGKSGLCSSFKF